MVSKHTTYISMVMFLGDGAFMAASLNHMIANKCQHYDHFFVWKWETPTISNVSNWGTRCRVAIVRAGILWFFPQTFQRDPWCGRPRGRDNGTRTEIQVSTFLGARGHFHGYHLHNYITYKHVRNPHVWDMGPQLYLTNYPLSSPTTDMDSYGVSSAIRSWVVSVCFPWNQGISWYHENAKKKTHPGSQSGARPVLMRSACWPTLGTI